jgi:hypothetical protein
MGGRKTEYTTLAEKSERKSLFTNTCLRGRITLKRILKKYGLRMRPAFAWLRIRCNGEPL